MMYSICNGTFANASSAGPFPSSRATCLGNPRCMACTGESVRTGDELWSRFRPAVHPALGWTPRSAGVTRRHTRQRSDLCGCYDGVAVPMISRPDFTSGSSRQMAQLGDDVLSARRPALFGRRVDGERTVRARGLPRRSDARSHLAVGFSPSGVPTPQGDVVSISPIGARGVIVSSASGRDARCMLCTFC